MLTVGYLANRFPCAVEPYVRDEIEELRSRGVQVVPGSVLRTKKADETLAAGCEPEIVLQTLTLDTLLRAMWLCVRRWKRITPTIWRVLLGGREGALERVKALGHTVLGACYAAQLEARGIGHIHVHHGYFGSWVGMVAARLLGVGFSMTLHGSDVLLKGTYLDVKLKACAFCLTVSEYNRRHILGRYPDADPDKVVVARLGAELCKRTTLTSSRRRANSDPLTLLAVGRLHAVKDHAFLVRACAQLQAQGMRFECSIAGDGPERHRLEAMIRKFRLEERVTLLGHLPRQQMDSLYDRADVVVLTSRSEGVPLVLMEAMARGKIVLAPAITGIPELVIAGKTGFLYEPGSLGDFVARLLFICSLVQAQVKPDRTEISSDVRWAAKRLEWVRHAARVQVFHNFNRKKNLESFGELFLRRIVPQIEGIPHENFVLQQIQLPLQRNRSIPV